MHEETRPGLDVRRNRRWYAGRRLLVLGCAALLAAACGRDPGAGGQSEVTQTVSGRTFLSESVTEDGASRELVEGTRIRLSFGDDGSLSAYAGCNTMSGRVEVRDERLFVGAVGATRIGCDPELHAQDEWFEAFLITGPSFELDGHWLTLQTGSTTIRLLDRVVADPDRALDGTVWWLDGMFDAQAASSVPAGVAATLEIGGGRLLFVIDRCNQGGGDVEVAETTMRIGVITTTDVACQEPALTVERAIHEVLAGEVTYSITAASLTLEHPSGRGLTFRARE